MLKIFDIFGKKKKPKERNEKDLIKSILNGNNEEYSLIVEKYQNKIYKYISKITNLSEHDNEDLTQEVFIKAFEKLNSYDDKYNFSTWLYRIAHNHTIDNYKKKKIEIIDNKNDQEEENDYNLDIINNIIDKDKDIVENLNRKSNIEDLNKVLGLLDIKYKEVLVLKFLEGKSYEDISDILEIPKGTVSTYITRAKKQFKYLAEKEGIEFELG